jgi:molybdopterin-guanine dinucleotide biosynthesis protein A
VSRPLPADAHRGITGAIVAGGANERFGGEPKGLRRVGGVRILDRVAAAIRAVTPEIVLVANTPDADAWLDGVPVYRDVRSERGSVVGLHTAITALGAGQIALVVAWDMPFVSADLLALLVGRVREGASAAIPETESGPQPFCAAYTRACLSGIERAIADGDFRMSSLVAALPNVSRIGETDLRRFGDPGRLFFNVNTPADLQRAESMASTA